MNKFLQKLFLFEKFTVQTKLSKQRIQSRVESFIEAECHDYYGKATKRGFFIGEKFIKHRTFVRINNSFAPVARARILEADGTTTVSVVMRMHLFAIVFAPIYLASLLTVLLFPFVSLLLRFAFFNPKKRLKQSLEALLIDDTVQSQA